MSMMEKKIIVTERDYLLISNFINYNRHMLSAYTLDRLSKELEEARVVAEEKTPQGVIRLNSAVELLENTLDKRLKIKFVLPSEADPRQQKISIFSPLGMALIGYQEGDVVEWELHGIVRQYQVLKVVNQINEHEASS